MGVFSKFNQNSGVGDFSGSIQKVEESNTTPQYPVLDELALRELPKRVSYLASDVEQAKIEVAEIKQMAKEMGDELNKQVDGLIPNVIGIFGIFATLTTFVTGEIQVFKVYCDPYQIVGMSFLFTFVLLVFLIVTLTFYRPVKDTQTNFYPYLATILVILLVAGSILFAMGAGAPRCDGVR